MTAKKDKPGKIAGKQIRKQVSALKGDVQGVRSGVSRDMKGVKKGFSKSLARTTRKLSTQNTAIQSELEKLRSDLSHLKVKQTPKRDLSMYNLFVRQQIRQGKTFEQATKSWKSSRKIIENPGLAKGKTRTRTIPKTRVVVRKVPVEKIVVRNVTRKVSRPVVKGVVRVEHLPNETKESLNKIMRQLSALKSEVNSMEKEVPPSPKVVPKPGVPVLGKDLPNEEVAVRLTHLYFEEIARLGFKRRLDFDSIINAYYYCLQRLHNKDKELEIMRKIVDREESKIQGEPKSQLFPQPE
jgi:predicted  nucleic acid-binding Zn-ribbon protein